MSSQFKLFTLCLSLFISVINGSLYKNVCSDLSYQYPYFRFIPIHLKTIKLQDQPSSHLDEPVGGSCFEAMTINAKLIYSESSTSSHSVERKQITAKIEFNLVVKRALLCTQNFLIGNTFQNYYFSFFQTGKHELDIIFKDPNELIDVIQNGISIFAFCSDYHSVFSTFLESMSLFGGGFGFSKYLPVFGNELSGKMIRNNAMLIGSFMQIELEERVIKNIYGIEKKMIQNGDVFLARRMDGMKSLTMIVSGSHVGHCAVAMWINKELYILESKQLQAFSLTSNNIIKTKFDEWIEREQSSTSEVVWLPLKQEYRTKMDIQNALKFFTDNEGSHGAQGFIFAYIDTLKQNYPLPFTAEFMPLFLRELEMTDYNLFYHYFLEGLNKRLNFDYDPKTSTDNPNDDIYDDDSAHKSTPTTFEELYIRMILEKNLTLAEVLAIPERDDWTYSQGKSFTPSSFVMGLLKASGMFGNIDFQASEFTIKDIYQLSIFDIDQERLEECQIADPHLKHCQLMGEFRIQLPGVSSIDPYDNMNEQCPSLPISYYRPDNC